MSLNLKAKKKMLNLESAAQDISVSQTISFYFEEDFW